MFGNLMELEWLMKCPVCGAAIEKVDGCEFVTCVSA